MKKYRIPKVLVARVWSYKNTFAAAGYSLGDDRNDRKAYVDLSIYSSDKKTLSAAVKEVKRVAKDVGVTLSWDSQMQCNNCGAIRDAAKNPGRNKCGRCKKTGFTMVDFSK